MSTTLNSGGNPGGLLARAKAIILTPKAEWPVIAAEPASTGSIYLGYIVPLAAIGPAAAFIHAVVFGYGFGGFAYHPSFIGALANAIVSYAFTLAGVFVLALIIDALAPTFGGQRNQLQALKLAAYASTASWLAGIFGLIPGLGVLMLLGIYSLYLFYTGLPVLMGSPPEKSLVYTVVVIIAGIVVSVIIGAVSAVLPGHGGLGAAGYAASGTITTPSGGELPLNNLQQAAKAFADSASNAANGKTAAAVPAAVLKALLPPALDGGLPRTDLSSAGGQVGGFGGRAVTATYGSGDKQITLTVADLGLVGALAGFGSALGVSGDNETATSYSRLTQQNGRTIAEEYDRTSRHGSYGVVIANRFMIHAESTGLPVEDLRNAVASVDAATLEALGRKRD